MPVNAPSSKFDAAPHQADSAPAAAATAPVNESNEPEQAVTNRLARTFSGLGGLLGGGGEPSATTLGEDTEHSEA